MDEWMDHASVIVAKSPAIDRSAKENEWILLVMDKKEAFDMLLRAFIG